jgi:hypothetical protein
VEIGVPFTEQVHKGFLQCPGIRGDSISIRDIGIHLPYTGANPEQRLAGIKENRLAVHHDAIESFLSSAAISEFLTSTKSYQPHSGLE